MRRLFAKDYPFIFISNATTNSNYTCIGRWGWRQER